MQDRRQEQQIPRDADDGGPRAPRPPPRPRQRKTSNDEGGNSRDGDGSSNSGSNSAALKDLSELAHHVAQCVEENSQALAPPANRPVGAEGAARDVDPSRKEATKKRIKALLNRMDRVEKMPLWRHLLAGRRDPPQEAILKGLELFRVIAWAIVVVYVRPRLAIHKRKLAARDKDRKDLQQTLNLYLDETCQWIGKLVRVPIESLEQVRASARFSDGSVTYALQV